MTYCNCVSIWLPSDFVDEMFDELSLVDFAQEWWKLVYPVVGSCILSMYFLASRESGANPMMEIVGLKQCACVYVYVQGGPGSQYSGHEEVLWR